MYPDDNVIIVDNNNNMYAVPRARVCVVSGNDSSELKSLLDKEVVPSVTAKIFALDSLYVGRTDEKKMDDAEKDDEKNEPQS